MSARALRLIALSGVLLVGGCGYFNSLYNANRRFADAERAALSGDRARANREYLEAIERAAVSYRRYPDGRWADDALLLIGRARFSLTEYDAAAAAMRALLEQSGDPEKRSIAHAYLGASLAGLRDYETSAAHLDSAAAALRADSDEGAFVRLWSARTAFETGRADAGWAALDVAARSRRTAREAALEGLRRSLAIRDSARTHEFMQRLAQAPETGRVQQVDSVLRRIATQWSPAIALHTSEPLATARWPAQSRDAVAMTRADLADLAGEQDIALGLALGVAEQVSGGAGSRARLLAATIRLSEATRPEELEEIRELLLPAFDDQRALEMMRRVKAAQILMANGEDAASTLSLFAAAEMLRDELGAPLLASVLFRTFAEAQPGNVWAGKAALAAYQLVPSQETGALVESLAANPYVRSVRGGPAASDEIDRAEERLAYGLAGLRTDALAEAVSRDVIVGRAVAELDSTRLAARNDSVRIACGTFIDSLRIAGIRADSMRAACLRGDSVRVAFVLTADTTALRDTVSTRTRPAPQPGRADPDTLAL